MALTIGMIRSATKWFKRRLLSCPDKGCGAPISGLCNEHCAGKNMAMSRYPHARLQSHWRIIFNIPAKSGRRQNGLSLWRGWHGGNIPSRLAKRSRD